MRKFYLFITFFLSFSFVFNATVKANIINITQNENYNNNEILLGDLEIDELLSSSDEKFFNISAEISEVEGQVRSKKIIPLLIKISYSYNKTNRQFDFSFNVDAPTEIIKPRLSSGTMTIKKATAKLNSYTTVGTSSTWTNLSFLTNYKKSVPATTGHYKVYVDITPANGVSISNGNNNVYWCINRTGHIWVWNYVDSLSNKIVSEPPTNWVKNAVHSRPSNLNTTYKQLYDSMYNTNLNLSGTEVHHIQPLAYGGNNTMANLIHLPKSTHSGVTAWFAGY